MKRIFYTSLFLFLLTGVFGMFFSFGVLKTKAVSVQDDVLLNNPPTTIYFFHSNTCPHCREERVFLKELEGRYQNLVIESHEIEDADYAVRLKEIADKAEMEERYRGLVPLTFLPDEYYVGFESARTTGVEIENGVRRAQGLPALPKTGTQKEGAFSVPYLGSVDPNAFSLPVLAIVLGALDGVNVCSLGALFIVLTMALTFRSRKKIILFGGAYLLTTALSYGLLIFLWHQLFTVFSAYLGTLKIIIGLLGILGGLYFLREFWSMKKKGVVCDIGGSTFVERLVARVRSVLGGEGGLWRMMGAVVLFAFALTVVEFPCSAAVPVAFAALLADSGLSYAAQFGYLALFLLFYLIDEIILYTIAATRLSLWHASNRISLYAMGAGGVILFALGVLYLLRALAVL